VKPIWVVTIAALAALVWLARGLLLPVFLAMVFAYLLSPIVARADALAIRRSVAVGVLFAVMITLLLGAGLLVGPRMLAETSRLVEGLPALATRIDTALDRALRELVETLPMLGRVLPEGEGWIHRLVLDPPPRDPSEFFEHMGHLFLLAILVPFFAFFLLRDMPSLITLAMNRLPPQHVETSVAVALSRVMLLPRPRPPLELKLPKPKKGFLGVTGAIPGDMPARLSVFPLSGRSTIFLASTEF
jgi:predicted PurR-regulated permease PerM